MLALLERNAPPSRTAEFRVAESRSSYDPSAADSGRTPAGKIPEKLLARLWQQRAARQQEFRASGGRRVRVLYPGRAGTAAGPDFRDALLEVEGLGLVQGDVELHVRQQDWYAHGHAEDPNYNGVVLHAALETSPQVTRLQSGHLAPVISLTSLLNSAPAPAPDREEARDSGRIWNLLELRGWPRPADAAELGELLDAAGDARFQAKSAAFRAFMQEQSAAQTLYEGLMEALGYRANRQPFLKLAHRAPWSALTKEVFARPAAERRQVVESRLLKLSGLAPEPGSPSISRAPANRGYGSALAAAEWRCFRVRPANHPRRRLAGAARLFARFLAAESVTSAAEDTQLQLIDGLGQVLAPGRPAKLTAALTVPADPGPAAPRTAYIGAARAKDLAVNVVLPFFDAFHTRAARAARAAGGSDHSAHRLYRKFGKLQNNELTREMAGLLLEPGYTEIVTTARRQQGLIHLYRQLAGAGPEFNLKQHEQTGYSE